VEYRRQQGLAGTGNSLGLFLSLPLTIYDRNQGGIARAQAEIRQSELRIAALEREIRAQLEATYAQCRAANTVLLSFESGLLEQARDVLNVTNTPTAGVKPVSLNFWTPSGPTTKRCRATLMPAPNMRGCVLRWTT
jgi:hypothetical protein